MSDHGRLITLESKTREPDQPLSRSVVGDPPPGVQIVLRRTVRSVIGPKSWKIDGWPQPDAPSQGMSLRSIRLSSATTVFTDEAWSLMKKPWQRLSCT